MRRAVALLVGVVLLAGCGATQAAAPVTVVSKQTVSVIAAPITQIVTVTRQLAGTTVLADPVTATITMTHTVTTTAIKTKVATVTVTAQPQQAPQPAVAASFPDGSYLVGKEMPAGNYQATGGDPTNCFWFTYDNAHTAIDGGNSTLASVPATAYSFQSNGCGTWKPVS
jgi:hypothetical protein